MATSPTRIAVYPGTFDPLTNGHASLVRRGLQLFDYVIIAVAADTPKTPLFSLEERVTIAKEAFADTDAVIVEPFSGLLVDYAAKHGATTILRGLRAVSDYEYEFQLSLMNRKLQPNIETVFLISDYRWLYISSTIIKTVASLRGSVHGLVPPVVEKHLIQRFGPSNDRIPPEAPEVYLHWHKQNKASSDS